MKMARNGWRFGGIALACAFAFAGPASGAAEGLALPPLECVAEQTGGFHDYPEDGEHYEPALFHPEAFALEENTVFMLNLLESERRADLYLTLEIRDRTGEVADAGAATELECRQVRGADGGTGYSCVNLPPSELLLINARTLRFTRTSVGGWTFAGATGSEHGDSIFVEYGQCTPQDAQDPSAPSGPPAR